MTIGQVLDQVADRLEKQNGNIQNVLETDRVFEYGFDHLAGGFDAGVPANQIFSQWVSILPTDQIVAVEVAVGEHRRFLLGEPGERSGQPEGDPGRDGVLDPGSIGRGNPPGMVQERVGEQSGLAA